MLINLGLSAYVLGNMTVLLTKADAHTATYRDRLSSLNRWGGHSGAWVQGYRVLGFLGFWVFGFWGFWVSGVSGAGVAGFWGRDV